ncbi:IS1380 family transposase [Kyrpidia tusciae]|uniref:Transposase IS4 family protein n=1 Tax=Kyrpidia tusciae (strain DSM 2912 / NBRC 15312 / T2) TaxID=562970 RepID=D5WRU9_KYRT2|nr:IS1380 family transposase [Kyrpidia tusciae]ADG06901.1 transposase IS4 family protein [Kyrpidia tusciae DSM 2912]
MHYIIEESDEILTTHSGLALVGRLLGKTQLASRLNAFDVPERSYTTISNRGVAYSYLGLLCQGKSDFDHIEPFREDESFPDALGVAHVPSSPTLRQRLDLVAPDAKRRWQRAILEESARLLRIINIPLTPIVLGEDKRTYLPLDIDVSPFDNSGTKKEGVSRTYKGCDGYAPIFAYLEQEGYALNVELRTESTHCQKGTAAFLVQSIRYAHEVSDIRPLVRMDAGNDSVENLKVCRSEETAADFIIRKNLRKESPEAWLLTAQQHGTCEQPREGKKVYRGALMSPMKGLEKPVRMVFEVIERTMLSDGQILLIPQIEVSVYLTSLPDDPSVVIDVYHAHGTMEQFHSEIKTDLDLERLPSGKFATNDLVLHFGLLAHNLLRIMGQESLQEQDGPLRKKAQRRRLRTVIQNLITLAAKMIKHARQMRLRLGRGNRWLPVFRRLYEAFG